MYGRLQMGVSIIFVDKDQFVDGCACWKEFEIYKK